jgi:1-acyl-sn-glycerol-3-phosphate acyltransferase
MIRRRPPRSAPTLDITLGPEDLAALWEPFDPEAPAFSHRDAAPVATPDPTPHDPIDWSYCESLDTAFLGDIVDAYFRGRLEGVEHLPAAGPCIIAPNHSGNAFPHDAIVLDGLLWRQAGLTRAGKYRSVFSPSLAAVWWMRPYGLDNWWRRGGGVDMTFANFDRLLARGDRVIYYPEGVPGIGKGFLKRYQLQHYYSSFVVLAARHRAPVVPVSVVNAEWVNPTSVTFGWLNAVSRAIAGLPFFPVPTAFLAVLFPFVFYLAFPCRMVFVAGAGLDVRAMLEDEGADPDAPDKESILRVADRVRQISQEHLNAEVRRHGEKPWDLRGLWRALRALPSGRRLRATPFGWPWAYVQHDRDRHRAPARNRLHAFVRDMDVIFYYVPFGWLGIALARNLRRAPYGYRGMTREERREREGSYRWLLETRPLPPRPVPPVMADA